MSAFEIRDEWRIPIETGQAVGRGWTDATEFRPVGVTWHWTATSDLATCRRLLGGPNPERQGQASAHYGVGRSFGEGVDRYVSLDDRSWHAGKNQTIRFDGRSLTDPNFKASRTSIGVETVNIGFERPEVPAQADWIRADSVDGRQLMKVQPWTEEQLEMMIAVGKEIVARWPHLTARDHHGHHDLCPGYKVDVAGFPFALVLRGIYDDPAIPDPFTATWTNRGRRATLSRLGYLSGLAVDDDTWYQADALALRRFQRDADLMVNGLWTTWVAWRAYDLQAAP